jgi:two-component system phosphate regulon sensor histidine kinase PhoR
MKKRIITSSIVTVLFAIVIVTSSFVALSNIEELEQTKKILSLYNKIVSVEGYRDNSIFEYKVNGNKIRFTFVNKDGEVIFDNTSENLDNHGNREEIIEAFKYGSGSSVRYSETLSEDLVYYATKINDNLVIRSSVPANTVSFFNLKSLKYYVTVVIIAILLSLVLSIKLVKIIIHPVNDLQRVTSKIAGGELNKRAFIYHNDEIGTLARTFNNMADQLQIKINDSLDKQNKLEAILESMESGVIAIDNENNIMLINPYARNLFGLDGDIIGENISEYIIDYDLLQFIRNILDIDTKEMKLFHPQERELRVKKAPIISSDGTIGIVISVQDITDIKRLESMRSQFVANVTHELKTPLTSIKGFAETLRYVEDEQTRNKFLDIINKEAERLTRLINDILVLSDIENHCRLSVEKFYPYEVIDDVLYIVKKQSDQKFIKVYFDNNFNETLTGDRDKFYQLCLNLVENSIKYSNENSKVNIITKEVKGKFILEVIDNGIGIPKDDLPRIFERFYRVDKSRSTRGTGLGLAIVKHIVKLFNGEIFVESKLGEGTKFTIKIKK